MFENWGFLMGEMIVLIIVAALLGLFVGWLIWARRKEESLTSHLSENSKLRTDLAACKSAHGDKDVQITALRAELKTAKAAKPTPVVAKASSEDRDYDGDGKIEGADEGTRPEALTEARDGQPDDLKLIKGIGPKLEKLCNSLGFYHFDQIAGWSADEIAWVDANLEGFKGRVSRDTWVDQAKVLAAGGATEFSDRVKDGDVY